MESISFSLVFSTLAILIGLHILIRFIIKPLSSVYYYSKQGLRPTYIPILGEWGQADKIAKQYGDAQNLLVKTINADPNFVGTTSPLGDRCTVFLTNIKHIKALLQNQADNVIKHQKFIWPWKEYVTKTSITFREGDDHKRLRRILAKSFHFDYLKRNIPVISKIAKEAFDDLEISGLNDIHPLIEMGAITGEVIGRTFFGFDHKKAFYRGKKITDAVFFVETEAPMLSKTLLYQIFGPKLVKLQLTPYHKHIVSYFKGFREYCSTFVAKRKEELRADPSKANLDNLIDGLLLQQFEDEKNAMSDPEILDQYIVFFLAGQQTTAHWLTMILYCLAKNPEYVEKIRNEIKTTIKDTNNLDYNELTNMVYLNAVMKEVLRLYPPVHMFFFREAIRDFQLCELKIKKGTLLNVFLGHSVYNEKIFKNARNFDPTRWMDQGEGTNLPDPFCLIPFSAGDHSCIGQHMAWLQTRIILIHLISRFNVTVPDDYKLIMTQRLAYEPLEFFNISLHKLK